MDYRKEGDGLWSIISKGRVVDYRQEGMCGRLLTGRERS